MVTLDDVAARAGVSRMTASNALRGKTVVRPETARKVIAAAEELGYHPNLAARQLSSGRTHVIGLTVADFDLIFPAALAAAISDRAQTLGYQVIVQQTRFSHDFERRMLSSATSQICDGTIICWPSSASAEMETFARAHPLVLLDGFGLEGRCDCVFTPCAEGMAAAMRHLIEHGCRRVLMLGGSYLPPERFAEADTSERRRIWGAAEGLLSNGLPYRAARRAPAVRPQRRRSWPERHDLTSGWLARRADMQTTHTGPPSIHNRHVPTYRHPQSARHPSAHAAVKQFDRVAIIICPQQSAQEEGDKIRQRQQTIAGTHIARTELYPELNIRVRIGRQQRTHGFGGTVPGFHFHRHQIVSGPNEEILLQRRILPFVVVQLIPALAQGLCHDTLV